MSRRQNKRRKPTRDMHEVVPPVRWNAPETLPWDSSLALVVLDRAKVRAANVGEYRPIEYHGEPVVVVCYPAKLRMTVGARGLPWSIYAEWVVAWLPLPTGPYPGGRWYAGGALYAGPHDRVRRIELSRAWPPPPDA